VGAAGAKKGDAVIAAHLEAADIRYFISENRHFLFCYRRDSLACQTNVCYAFDILRLEAIGMNEQAAVSLLGGRKTFGHDIRNALDIDEEIRRGFPVSAIITFKHHTRFSSREVSILLGVSEKTLERAQAEHSGRLKPTASDRLYRTARIIALAEKVLENRDQAVEWLRTLQFGLGNRVPLDLLATEAGAHEVENLLLRIEHGFLA
jgi:putative toxin-antitoxin system antitoxin component (TIGR02293 family)